MLESIIYLSLHQWRAFVVFGSEIKLEGAEWSKQLITLSQLTN